ncbi:MAG: hypothetical protein OEM38_08910, partial [Gammaproteobacteria bacterium]|nr:hypothetical protein [Gammaproteobacteria bacterium]
MIKKAAQGSLALLFFILPAVALADNLLDAFELAIESDPNLKAAQSARKALLEEHSQTLAKYFPTIKVYSHVGKASQDIKQAIADDPADSY